MRRVRQGSDIVFKWLWKRRKWAAVVVVLLALIVVFADILIPAVVILAFGTIASFSTMYKRVIRVPPAVELVTFTTVMVSLAYGPLVGAVYGAVVSLTAEILTNALDVFVISFVPSRAIIALTAGFFFSIFDGSVLLTGLASTILYNALAQPFYLFLADVEMRAKSLYFLFINIGTNFIIFSLLGSLVASLLGIA